MSFPAEANALFEACEDVPAVYLQMPLSEDNQATSGASWVYRERVYCYELYHRWRSKWPINSHYLVAGEVDKAGHPIVRKKAAPDFIVHQPGKMDNLLVLEVKHARSALDGVVKDLRTLSHFRKEAGYKHAFLLIYGLPLSEWEALSARVTCAIENKRGIQTGLVTPVLHSSAGQKAKVVSWA